MILELYKERTFFDSWEKTANNKILINSVITIKIIL